MNRLLLVLGIVTLFVLQVTTEALAVKGRVKHYRRKAEVLMTK